MMKKNFLIVFSALAILAAAPASAAVRFSLAGAGSYGLTSSSIEVLGATVETKGGLGFGGGALIEFGLGKSAGLELGALYLSRKMTTTTTFGGESTSVSSNSDALHVPAGFRFWLNPRFSLLFAGTLDYSLEDSATDKTTFGGTAGFRWSLPTKSFAFFLEPRFNYGFEKILDKNPMEALLLVGLTFGKGSK